MTNSKHVNLKAKRVTFREKKHDSLLRFFVFYKQQKCCNILAGNVRAKSTDSSRNVFWQHPIMLSIIFSRSAMPKMANILLVINSF